MTRLKKRKHKTEDMMDDEMKMTKEMTKDNVAIEYRARISPMKERERGNERLDNVTRNNNQR
jgi:hypothetical protein